MNDNFKRIILGVVLIMMVTALVKYIDYTDTKKYSKESEYKMSEVVNSKDIHILELEKKLCDFVNKNYKSGGFVSISIRENKKNNIAEYNNKKVYAASLIKLFVASSVYEKYNTLPASQEDIEENLTNMITVSDNEACDNLVSYIGNNNPYKGMEYVNEFCQKYDYNNTKMGWLKNAPIENGDNFTSMSDCTKILDDALNNKIPGAQNLINLMKMQDRRSKIPSGIPENVIVANKTGELVDAECDAAIIYAPKTTYVLCVACENVEETNEAVDFIKNLSSFIYNYFNE